MLYTIARTLRTPNQPKQWTHQILRTYSYKPVGLYAQNLLFSREPFLIHLIAFQFL